MCQLILRDEVAHIAFHRDRLAAAANAYGALWSASFKLLGQACTWFLWLGHGACFRTLGASRQELFHEVRSGLKAFVTSLRRAPFKAVVQPEETQACGMHLPKVLSGATSLEVSRR
jgi:hypothetical protein